MNGTFLAIAFSTLAGHRGRRHMASAGKWMSLVQPSNVAVLHRYAARQPGRIYRSLWIILHPRCAFLPQAPRPRRCDRTAPSGHEELSVGSGQLARPSLTVALISSQPNAASPCAEW